MPTQCIAHCHQCQKWRDEKELRKMGESQLKKRREREYGGASIDNKQEKEYQLKHIFSIGVIFLVEK